MIALALLASHLVGDFLFQTRWQANGKLDDVSLRFRHVCGYVLAFVPVALAYEPNLRGVLFLALLWLLHFATDSRRFHSTIGDVLAWRGLDRAERRWAWQAQMGVDDWTRPTDEQQQVPEAWLRWPTPNPWTALPLMIDQTLHVVQLAALGWLLV